MLKKRYLPLLVGCGLSLFSACQNPNKNNVSTVFIHKYGVTLTQDDWHDRGANGQVVVTGQTEQLSLKTMLKES